MILVQKYLEAHVFSDLSKEHGVYASFDKSGSFWSLNYDMLEAKDDNLLAQQCRGLILSKVDGSSLLPLAKTVETSFGKRLNYDDFCPGETTILACPFFRFFNDGQGAAASVEWQDPSLKVYEKVDGTCAIVWFNPFTKIWNMSTRAVPEADVLLDNGKFTFRTLFEKALSEMANISFDEFTSTLDTKITYIFELIGPWNRIVVDYPKSQVIFIGARSLETLQEFSVEDPLFKAQLPKIPIVNTYPLNNVVDIHNYVSNQNPLQHEGVVAVDSKFNRVKIKNAQYLVYNRARDVLGSSDRNCLELILGGTEDDLIPVLPQEIVDNLLEIKEKLNKWIIIQDEIYKEIIATNPADQKSFALLVMAKANIYSAAFFAIYAKKANNIKDFLMKNRKNGAWSSGFLEKILGQIKK